jgi:[acyl-carrier-protein] S-malonyltransferase
MSAVILLFAGQGAQKVGMGKDFVAASPRARELCGRADEVLGFALSDVMVDGPDDELTRTSRCQPALFLHGLMCLELLRERCPGLESVATAGLSLGEFTAHAAAGTFGFDDGLRLVARRGEFMEEACAATRGAMAAMIGGEEAEVVRLAADCGVDVANYNAPGQIVLSGAADGIAAALAKAREFGIRRAVALNVAGAYHSRLMAGAQEKLAAELARVRLDRPRMPVVCNVDAREVADPAEIRASLARQVTGSVRWTDSIRRLRQRGQATFLELGPGRVLSGLIGKIDRDATVHAVEDLASLEAAAAALNGA